MGCCQTAIDSQITRGEVGGGKGSATAVATEGALVGSVILSARARPEGRSRERAPDQGSGISFGT